MLWHGEHLRLLGMRGGCSRGRGHHLPHVQNRAVRWELDSAGVGSVVVGSDSRVGDGVSLAVSGGLAFDGNAAAGSGDVVVPVQVGETSVFDRWGVGICLLCRC